jgi:hypothetical protein
MSHSTSSGIGVQDAFKDKMNNNVQDVSNAVLNVQDASVNMDHAHFVVMYQNAKQLISVKILQSRRGETTFTPEQGALSVKYRTYLGAAYDVVDSYSKGEQPDLTKMNAAKAALN